MWIQSCSRIMDVEVIEVGDGKTTKGSCRAILGRNRTLHYSVLTIGLRICVRCLVIAF